MSIREKIRELKASNAASITTVISESIETNPVRLSRKEVYEQRMRAASSRDAESSAEAHDSPALDTAPNAIVHAIASPTQARVDPAALVIYSISGRHVYL